MNWSVLKDIRSLLGFIASSLLAVAGIMLAVNNQSYWVVFIVFSLLLTFLSVRRAERIYNQNHS